MKCSRERCLEGFTKKLVFLILSFDVALRAAFRAGALIKTQASSTLRAGTGTVRHYSQLRRAFRTQGLELPAPAPQGRALPQRRAARARRRAPPGSRQPGFAFPRSASFGARWLGLAVPANNGTVALAAPAETGPPHPTPARLARSRSKALQKPTTERQRRSPPRRL